MFWEILLPGKQCFPLIPRRHSQKGNSSLSMSSRIRRARSLSGITQAELARRVGVQRSAVTQWESEGGTSPSVGHLTQIACEMGVSFEWVATGRGQCRPEVGALDAALLVGDFARDAMETRLLECFRRVARKKREALVKVVELLAR